MKNESLSRPWLFLVFLALFSCRTEETLISTPYQNSEYKIKSLWKEDEVFIKNVKKVYDENADENRMISEYGTILWDYATSLNTYNETYLIAPVFKNNKVLSYVEAKRIDNRVFFEFTKEDEKINDFFNTIIFTKKENLSTSEKPQTDIENDNQYSTQSITIRTLQCKTVTITLSIGEIEEGGSNQGGDLESTTTQTVCKFVDTPVDQTTCINYDEFGNCTGSGGNGGGYTYNPEEEEEIEDECTKAKETIENIEVSEKINNLNNSANFLLDHELGFYEKDGQFFPTTSEPFTNFVKAQTSTNCLTGIVHTHQNKDCFGDPTIKVPSPEDLMIFMQIPVVQAKNCLGNTKKAYSITITSAGVYMLKYTNANLPTNTNYNLDTWGTWYDSEYKDLIKNNQFTQANIEKIFSKFLDSCVSIDGLEVYKISDNKVEKLEYDSATDTTFKIECP